MPRRIPPGSRHRSCVVALLLTTVMVGSSAGAEARRLALVIGNDNYQSATPLHNARTDAQAVAEALGQVGFEVTLKKDLTLKQMKDAVRVFKDHISGGDEAVFYFAGHGVQFEGTNYLIPIDLVPESEEEVADDALPLQRVLDDLRDQKTRFALAIVDACRDNPFKGAGRAIGGRGLAPVSAATGQMVMYSAGVGQEALDRLGPRDTDPNGVFTRVLIKEIRVPGIPASQLLKIVQSQVVEMAKTADHEQVPALYDQSIGEFYFAGTAGGTARDATAALTAPVTAPERKVSAVEVAKPYALLAGTRDPNTRQKMEQALWEQLRHSLPTHVLYGFEEHKQSGSEKVFAFQPASVVTDGRTATLTHSHGVLDGGHLSWDDANDADLRVNCDRHEMVVIRYANHGAVKYTAAADLGRETYKNDPESSGATLEEAFCQLPLRITPVWGVKEVEWTDIGPHSSVALQIRWSDPKRPNEQFALNRWHNREPTHYGAEVNYGWIGINCATREERDTGYYEFTATGELLGVTGSSAQWKKLNEGSPAENFYVLICELHR